MISISLLATAPVSATPTNSTVTVTPDPIDELFANPGMGWQTFHRFADEDPNLQGLPSGSAYFRFYWNRLEPSEGEIDFALLDDLLAHARRAGQKLALRVMCVGTDRQYMHVPEWLREKGLPGWEFRYQGRGPVHWAPDMDDSLFQEAHFRFLRELGRRYDGHPDLDLVDIGTVGLWGEWHMSGTGVPMPSEETRRKIIDVYLEAFPNTPKVMLIGDAMGMPYAIARGAGWRADCLGDMGGFSKNWNHMENLYPQRVRESSATDTWKQAPVAFETCWDMRRWVQEGWDVRYIFDYALDFHASYVNNKSAPIPEGYRSEVERLLRRLGYRLVLRSLRHPGVVRAGGGLPLAMEWENVGVAPPYRDYYLGVRLVAGDGSVAFSAVSDVSIRGWLPGMRRVDVSVLVPERLTAGEYALEAGVVERPTNKPAVRLAIEGRTEESWYRLSRLIVRRS